ncbi:MAG: hypothetical protein ACD_75C01561G0006, partial [uncultured bacterium]
MGLFCLTTTLFPADKDSPQPGLPCPPQKESLIDEAYAHAATCDPLTIKPMDSSS